MDGNLALLGAAWFLSSALLSTYANTAFLNRFGDPAAHTLVRFAGSAIIGFASNAVAKPRLTATQISSLALEFRLSALFLFLANGMNSVALQYSGITLNYVVKATIPFWTVLVTMFLGERYTLSIYLSLIPTVGGVVLASWSDSNFNLAGLAAALCSTIAQTLLNLFSKRAVQRSGVTGQQAQFIMASLSACASLPLYVIFSKTSSGEDDGVFMSSASALMVRGDVAPLGMIALAALAYHSEYLLNFMYVARVSPLAFSVTDIARRVSIISAGALMFGKPLSAMNMLGIVIALGGVLWYSILNQSREGKKKA